MDARPVERERADRAEGVDRGRLPAIDLEAPGLISTATFALG